MIVFDRLNYLDGRRDAFTPQSDMQSGVFAAQCQHLLKDFAFLQVIINTIAMITFACLYMHAIQARRPDWVNTYHDVLVQAESKI